MNGTGGDGRQELGKEGEAAACRFLEAKGYVIRDRNVRYRDGEVDIVAEDGDVLCFVEVRTRSSDAFGTPAMTVSWRKQQRIIRTALRYLMQSRMPERMVRFDVVAIVGQGGAATLEHLPDAFSAGL